MTGGCSQACVRLIPSLRLPSSETQPRRIATGALFSDGRYLSLPPPFPPRRHRLSRSRSDDARRCKRSRLAQQHRQLADVRRDLAGD